MSVATVLSDLPSKYHFWLFLRQQDNPADAFSIPLLAPRHSRQQTADSEAPGVAVVHVDILVPLPVHVQALVSGRGDTKTGDA